MNQLALLALVPSALPLLAPAQTFIVDAAGGAGTHFRDIPPAIAAVPSGAVLRVRPGLYSGFTVANKSLTILGDGLMSTYIQAGAAVTIGPLAPGHLVVVRDFGMAAGTFVGSSLRVTNAQGHVVLDSFQLPPASLLFPVQVFSIDNSSDVHIHRAVQPAVACDLVITDACVEIKDCVLSGRSQAVAGAEGFAAVRAERSRVAMFGSTLLGGRGGSDFFSLFGNGGPAFEAIASTVDLGPGNRCIGGEGGIDPSGLGGYTIMRPGGPGLKLVASAAQMYSTLLAGGPGPCVVPGCNVFGAPLSIDANSSLRQPNAIAPVATLVGQPALNSSVDVVVRAGPSELALLAFGFTPVCLPFPTLIDFAGILTLPEIVFGTFVTDNNGAARYRLSIPSGWVLDRMVWAQYFTFPGAVLPGLGSNTVSIVVKS